MDIYEQFHVQERANESMNVIGELLSPPLGPGLWD
jgi:hypothetical protein